MVFNGIHIRSEMEMETIGKKLHIQELVFNPCPVNFINITALYFSEIR